MAILCSLDDETYLCRSKLLPKKASKKIINNLFNYLVQQNIIKQQRVYSDYIVLI